MALSPGTRLGSYEILAAIGAGGMGEVYRARDPKLGRDVAIKILPGDSASEPGVRARFEREARTVAALNHPHIVTIHEIAQVDGRDFIVMELVPGESLDRLIPKRGLTVEQATDYAAQIAAALETAHCAGVVHRDIKPANIMVSNDGQVKVLDFGLAKRYDRVDPSATTATALFATEAGAVIGTVAYMSPEQAKGLPVDARSDVFSFGALVYEMLTGRRAFAGDTPVATIANVLGGTPVPLTSIRSDVPAGLKRLIEACLQKDRTARPGAGDLVAQLEKMRARLTPSAVHLRTILLRRKVAVPALVIALGIAAGGWWWVWRSSGTRWAREVALPEILRLAALDRNGEAFLLATQAETRIAGDPVLSGLWLRISRQVSITTTPAGADVSLRLIGGNTTWHPVGRTPLVNTRLPRGVFWWRFERAGYEPIEIVRATDFTALLPGFDGVVVLPTPGSRPPGMVAVSIPPRGMRLTLTGFEYYKAVPAPDYYIDRHEVTNAEFKAFVDVGGYEKREYWSEPFVREGQTLDWTAAMTLFRDGTGRPGPSTWQGGTYPAGREDWPVAAVSWYEAAAYAAFRGKHLPTIYHWTHAARPELGNSITRSSHFGGGGTVQVGTAPGLGPYGTVDMAGNVKEWVWNEQAGTGKRYILGGAWNDPDYQFLYSDSRSPFDRSDTNGFRCVAYGGGPAPPASLAAPVTPQARDYATERPVADDVYRIYTDQYSYDRTPFDLRIESTDDASPHWRHEVVSMAAVYGGERMPVHLYLPKNVKPPYQAVLFFPGAFAIGAENSTNLQLNTFIIDFIVMSGRALVYPVYKYTYERSDPRVTSSSPEPTRANTTWMQQLVNDARRALDYLETRPDIDASRLAYYGLSWGGRLGPIIIALDPRIKAGVLLMGGLASGQSAPEVDPFNFAPRVRTPILMLNGDQDFIFPLQTSQRPLFQRLGTPSADKKHVLYPGGHEIFTTQRSQIVQEVVGWLDRYVGRVQ